MAERLTRRRIADYVAGRLVAGDAGVVQQLAAYIVAHRRQRETELIVRDIEDALMQHGVTIATVTTAHGLSDSLKAEVERLVGSGAVVRQRTDPELLGGVVISTPTSRYDGSVRRKISELRALKT